MARYFFTGGLMPAENTLLHFQEHLTLEDQWRVSGTHYERTANDWLANQDREREAVMAVLTAGLWPAARPPSGSSAGGCSSWPWRSCSVTPAARSGWSRHYRFVR